MSRRTAERQARRIEVRYWRRGNPQVHSGFTVDVSKSGIFLGTSQTLDPGERIRLELVDRDRSFIVEGQVARVHRVSLALRHIEQSGVGVRFVTPAELLQEMLGNRKGAARPGEGPNAAARSAAPPPAAAGAPPAAPGSPSPAARPSLSSSGTFAAPAAARPSTSSSGTFAAPAAARPSTTSSGVFAPPAQRRDRQISVEFVDRDSFLNVYQRDIASGGLFVSTSDPAKLHDIVTVELRPPVSTPQPLLFEARVVHCLDGSADGRGSVRGMGVQFLDPDRVRATLAPIVTELRR
jgi:Tfp pilus assembly protein PilZ